MKAFWNKTFPLLNVKIKESREGFVETSCVEAAALDLEAEKGPVAINQTWELCHPRLP